eukprot:3877241-Pleurochrysis_carterae.AAC.1
MARQRLSQELLVLVRSENFGDEHEVSLGLLRPRWRWMAATSQWAMAHNAEVYSATTRVARRETSMLVDGPADGAAGGGSAPGGCANEAAGGSNLSGVTTQRMKVVAPHDLRQGEKLRCAAHDGRAFTVTVPRPIPRGTAISFTVERVAPSVSRARDEIYLTLPPGLKEGETFNALLQDGREVVVTVPNGAQAGAQVQLGLPEPVEAQPAVAGFAGASAAPGPMKGASGASMSHASLGGALAGVAG